MKRIIPSLIALGAAVSFFVFSGSREKHVAGNAWPAQSEAAVADATPVPVASKVIEETNGAPRINPDALLASRGDLQWSQPVAQPAFEAFRSWTHRFLAAPKAQQPALEAEGVALATTRRAELMSLIPSDPERAVELAVPVTVWRQMPVAVRAHLETRVDTKGDVLVEARTPMPGQKVEPVVIHANLGGENVRAYGEGRTTSKLGVPLSGIRLAAAENPGKPIAALSKRAGRVLEPVEVSAVKESFGEDPVCATSGLASTVNDAEVPLTIGGTPSFFCGKAHAAAALGDATGAALIAESYNSTGIRKMLLYRVDFSDYQGQRVDEATMNTLIADLKSFWDEMSYGAFTWAAVGATGSKVTPVMRLPLTADNYTDLGTFLAACRTAARAIGIEPNNYDFDMVVTAAKPSASFGGVGYVGWKGCWLANSSWNLGVGSHELGHNVGLNHANYWDVPGTDPIDAAGTSVEYGDPYDIMGGASSNTRVHYNVREKNLLGWAPNSTIHTAGAVGTYRIYAMDKKSTGAANQKRGIRVDRLKSDDDWWIDYRQLYAASNAKAKDGVWLHWGGAGTDNRKTNLIDMVPGGTKDDSPLAIGKTYADTSDPANPIYITPLARGNVDPDWVDVRIVQGGGLNKTPTITLAATTTVPNANVNTTITATAADADGDPLFYSWDMGDGTTTTNNSTSITYKYPTNGNRTVRCTVTDGRGGSATGSIVIKVGGQTIFTIQGAVKNVSGNPIEGVTVSAGGNRTDVTDNSGNYVITNLPAAGYTMTASKPGLTVNLASGTTNPVTVGPDRANINFTVLPGAPILGAMQSAIADAGSNTGDITLPLTDPDTPLTNITLTAVSSNVALVPNANVVFGSRGTARTVRVNARAGSTGNTTITITARDPQNNQSTTTWAVTVNNNPTITPTTLVTQQGVPVSIDLRTRASDDLAANTALAFQLSRAIGGTATLQPDGFTAIFTPTPGYQGTGSFRVTARDQSLSSRLVALYDFEPPDATTDGKASDRGNYHADALLDAVGTTEYNYRSDVPAALQPFSTKTLSFSDNGLDSAARLLRVFNPNDIDFSNNTSGWSFSTWVNRRSNTSDDFIFHLGAGDGFGTEAGESGIAEELQLYFPAGENSILLAKYGASGLENGFTASNVGVNEWHHVAVTCTVSAPGTGVFSLYLDGFLVGTTSPTSIAFSQTAPVAFGGHAASTKPGRWLDGSLDDVSLYGNVLPHSDVAGLSTFGTRHYLGQAATTTINVTINGTNDAPRIQPIANRRVPSGSVADTVPVEVFDAETPLRDLVVTATSSNTALVPNANLVVLPAQQWTSTDVGAVGRAGTTAESAGTLTVQGSGAQLDTAQDEFRFVHLPMTGDGEVVTRVVSMDYTHEKGRSGIMFRAGITDNAPCAFVGIGPGASAIFQTRTSSGGIPVTVSEAARLPMPRWLRLVRSGDHVSAFHAADNAGVRGEWAPLGSALMAALPATVNAGLAVNSHVDATLATTLFDNVSGDIPNGAKRKLIVAPVSGVPGTTTITVTVSDGLLTSSTAFDFSTNTAPTISELPDFGLEQGTASPAIPVFVGDDETGPDSVVLTAGSNNQSIIANADIVVSGTGAERSVTLLAKPGVKGLVEITLTANDGQLSSTRKFRVFVAPAGTIVVNVPNGGFGTVSAYFGENTATPGKELTISARPAPGQAFRGWRGLINDYSPKITFTMPAVMFLEAVFEATPYPRQSGTWNGLILNEPRTHGGSGGITMKVTTSGAYSGKVSYAGKAWSFRGIFHTDNTASEAVIGRKALAPLALNFTWDGAKNSLSGTLTEGANSSVVVAHHALYTTSKRPSGAQRPIPAGLVGKVTALFEADPIAGPIGSGFATGAVSASGAVKLVGKLADGSPFSCGSSLSLGGDFPFYTTLYKGNGSATGWLVWRSLPGNDFTGSVTTFRPANPEDATFSTGWPDGATLTVAGSYFEQFRGATPGQPAVLPLPAMQTDTTDANAFLGLDGATYVDEARELRISALGKIDASILVEDEKLSLTLKSTNGLLTGSATHGGKKIKLYGALLQKSNRGGGFTLTPGAAGVFDIELAE